MARYYDIAILSPSGATLKHWSSFPGSTTVTLTTMGGVPTSAPVTTGAGKFNPGALNVQFDLLTAIGSVPQGGSTITIEGVSLADMQQAQEYAFVPAQGSTPAKPGAIVQIKGGMLAPKGSQFGLITPSQAGLLLRGEVFQSWGNWVGTDMSLNLVFFASTYTIKRPGNFVLTWPKGQSLATAIQQMLNVTYPGAAIKLEIANYVNDFDVVHAVSTFSQMAQMIQSITTSPTSTGVDLVIQNDGSFLVTDGSKAPTAIGINFDDLIGQPQWVQANIMQFSTQMRADIQPGARVRMPKGLPNAPGAVTIPNGEAAFPSQLKYKTAFQGEFSIISARHIGNFRDTDGASWTSLFQAAPVNANA